MRALAVRLVRAPMAGILVCMGGLAADAEMRRAAADPAPEMTHTAGEGTMPALHPRETFAGGDGTSFRAPDRNAFSHPNGNLKPAGRHQFRIGDAIFRKAWVSAPASTRASDGLGPLFNARSCQFCHRKDGRGRPPLSADDRDGTLVLALVHPSGKDPQYGLQLQNRALAGLAAEGEVTINSVEKRARLEDGTEVVLRKPQYTVSNLGYGPLAPETGLSPRVAPPMIGMGLLEAIPAAAILALADPDDTNGDGISGRPSWIENDDGGRALGRFGWKASTPSIEIQTATAFANDIGIGNPLVPSATGDCTALQPACLALPTGDPRGDGLEIDQEVFERVVFYSRNLAVPTRRQAEDPDVRQGQALFASAGCASCHTPHFVTGRVPSRPEHSNQVIWPYSDLLLHDMGEGLADAGPNGGPLRREWRTAPLWGIGLTKVVSGTFRLLHDGRADGLQEAILWHGGEAAEARKRFAAMSAEERGLLLRFLESL